VSFAAQTAVLSDDGTTVHFPGIDYELGSKKIRVVPLMSSLRSDPSKKGGMLVVKIPGRGGWNGVGQPRLWHPSYYSVYEVKWVKGRTLGVAFLCDFRADGKAAK
jgi:hypothetical protein